MGVGAFIEPLVVVTLLFGGTWVNRNSAYRMGSKVLQDSMPSPRLSQTLDFESVSNSSDDEHSVSDDHSIRSSSPLLGASARETTSRWHKREVKIFGWKKEVTSPNTRRFEGRLLSRLLRKMPFLVEVWYWALIYWVRLAHDLSYSKFLSQLSAPQVYQLGRAFTAVTIVEGTVHVARHHALQIIHFEKKLHIFYELQIQHYFLQHPRLLTWINNIYSFIHIPGTILFLVGLYYYTTTRNRLNESQAGKNVGEVQGSPAGPRLYEARRRTMAMCNLIAFIVFTIYPCMPPRLLSDPKVKGPSGAEARSYGFVDTVHGEGGKGSIWTENRFCNQYGIQALVQVSECRN